MTTTPRVDIERHDKLVHYLRDSGRIGLEEQPEMRTLEGGVSNRTVLVQRQGGNAWVLKQALPRLDAAERLYLQYALNGHPAREIARLAGLPVETVHKLAQRVKKQLREEIGETDAVKKWRLSV